MYTTLITIYARQSALCRGLSIGGARP